MINSFVQYLEQPKCFSEKIKPNEQACQGVNVKEFSSFVAGYHI